MIRSAIVPSPSVSLFVSIGCCRSVSSCGGEGALMSLSIVSLIASVSAVPGCVGAAGAAV
eukprot:2163823-Pleurochrysis_carterae.AAC.1